MAGTDIAFTPCTEQGDLLSAAQTGLSAPLKSDTSKVRSYQYHPYDPKKKPRASAGGKKKKFGVASTTLSSPATRQAVSQARHHAAQETVKLEVMSSPPAQPLGPSAAAITASYEHVMLQYAQNQLQQQTLLLQQTMLLQQLQALKAMEPSIVLPECTTVTAPSTPMSLLPSSSPATPDYPAQCNNMAFDLFNCSSPLSPLSTLDSEPSTPSSPLEFSFEPLPALSGLSTSVPRRASGSSETDTFGVTRSNSVDISMLPLPAPGVYAGVEELFVELNQNMSTRWQ